MDCQWCIIFSHMIRMYPHNMPVKIYARPCVYGAWSTPCNITVYTAILLFQAHTPLKMSRSVCWWCYCSLRHNYDTQLTKTSPRHRVQHRVLHRNEIFKSNIKLVWSTWLMSGHLVILSYIVWAVTNAKKCAYSCRSWGESVLYCRGQWMYTETA